MIKIVFLKNQKLHTEILYKNIIIITDGKSYEAWGSLVELCQVKKEFSYEYLKKKKYPFVYKGIEFIRVPFRSENGI